MKGKVFKTEEGYSIQPENGGPALPLHPADIQFIQKMSQIFDNLDARIATWPEVEFEVVTIATGTSEWDVLDMDVALLKKDI